MKSRMMKMMLATVFGLLALPLSAATVTLDPASQDVQPGGMFSVDLLLNTGAEPGPMNSGTFRITWDSAKADFDGFIGPAVPPEVDVVPQAPGDLIVNFTNAVGQPFSGSLGAFSFSATAPQGDMIPINVDCPFGSPSECLFSGDSGSTVGSRPEFSGAEVNVVPIPATAWLMLSGLGVLGGIARRRS